MTARSSLACLILAMVVALPSTAAQAGTISDQFRAGAFGLPWSANASAVQAKYPNGTWTTDEHGRKRYCAASRQSLLKLPAQHQTRELCFLIGADGTLTSATAIARLKRARLERAVVCDMSGITEDSMPQSLGRRGPGPTVGA